MSIEIEERDESTNGLQWWLEVGGSWWVDYAQRREISSFLQKQRGQTGERERENWKRKRGRDNDTTQHCYLKTEN